MRATIVVDDNLVSMDGKPARTVDCTALAKDGTHAVQWYGVYGEVEFKGGFDLERRIPTRPPNETITDISPYQSYLDAYAIENAKQTLIEKLQQEQIERQRLEAEQSLAALLESRPAITTDAPGPVR
jgi:hypothetical protein